MSKIVGTCQGCGRYDVYLIEAFNECSICVRLRILEKTMVKTVRYLSDRITTHSYEQSAHALPESCMISLAVAQEREWSKIQKEIIQ